MIGSCEDGNASACVVVTKAMTIAFPVVRHRARQSWTREEAPSVGGRVIVDGRGGSRIVALNEVTLSLCSGDRLGILGHNGAGKSTLLRAIMGVYPPFSGSIRVRGRIASMLDIHTGFDTKSSGLDNIRLRALFMGVSRTLLEARLGDVAAFTELGEYLELPLATYSSGMRARLAFAIATGFDPEIVVMDEWLSAGDRDFRMKAEKRMGAFVDRADILVLASHNDALLQKNCNRAIVLEAGTIVYDGTPEEAIARRNEQVRA